MMPVEPPDNERVHAELPEQQAAIARMRPCAEGQSLRAIATAMREAGHPLSHEGVAGVLHARGG